MDFGLHQSKFNLLLKFLEKIKEISFSVDPILFQVCVDFSVENLETLFNCCFKLELLPDKSSPTINFIYWIIDFALDHKSTFRATISKLSTLMSIYNRGTFRDKVLSFNSLESFKCKLIKCENATVIQKSRLWTIFKESNPDEFLFSVNNLVTTHGQVAITCLESHFAHRLNEFPVCGLDLNGWLTNFNRSIILKNEFVPIHLLFRTYNSYIPDLVNYPFSFSRFASSIETIKKIDDVVEAEILLSVVRSVSLFEILKKTNMKQVFDILFYKFTLRPNLCNAVSLFDEVETNEIFSQIIKIYQPFEVILTILRNDINLTEICRYKILVHELTSNMKGGELFRFSASLGNIWSGILKGRQV
jgi:hypothetical protein